MKEGPLVTEEAVVEKEIISEDEFLSFMYGMIEQYLMQIDAIEDGIEQAVGKAQGLAKEIRRLKRILESIQVQKHTGKRIVYSRDDEGNHGYASQPKGEMGFDTRR